MRINSAPCSWISLTALAFAGCAAESEPINVGIDPPADMEGIEFEAFVDPQAGTIEFTRFGTSFRGLDPAAIVQDGTPGSGPTNTVELVTTNATLDPTGMGACGFASSFCADVAIRSFYTGPLNNVFAHITNITPAANHTGLNSDASQMGLSNSLGLWSYNTIASNTAGTRLWVFGDDGTGYRIGGRVMADLCSNGVQDGAETGPDCGGGCPGACTTNTFRLSRNQEIPQTGSQATGSCTTVLSGSQTTLTLNCTHDVAGVTAAHIHNAVAGVNGPILFNLGSGASPIAAVIAVTPAQATAMLGGNWYVNVHSAMFPGGAIRGQIGTTSAFPMIGDQENPPVASTAAGFCVVSLSPNQASLRVFCSHNVTSTAAHIHRGLPRVNGPIIFNFGAGTSPISTTVSPTAADVTDFLTGAFYVNVHSAAFPGGEIRGQISNAVDTAGSGAQETPPNGSPAGVNCRSFLSPNEANFDIRCTHNVATVTVAHIHRAPAGVAGPIVFPFGSAVSPFIGTFTFSAADANDYFARLFYVNVHSMAFPGGEVRGQITP